MLAKVARDEDMKQKWMFIPLAVIVVVSALPLLAQTGATKDDSVTAVEGESWLNHLNRPFNETNMGKTGHLGPPPPMPGGETSRGEPGLSPGAAMQATTLRGSDLYRVNCQGCHGETGQGAPPEINSVINPVRATSVAAVMERMKNTGLEISRTDARTLAQQSQTALLQRLHDGGQNMPAFPHLNEAEIHSLVAYLKQLAGIAGAEKEQIAASESPLRLGEHIVKSTCHTCHSAVGPDPTPQQLLDGAIPPLSTLPTRVSQANFIRKVTYGAPVAMGTPPMLYRGRMPVFYYLTQQEAADVYSYLVSYPPSEPSTPNQAFVLAKQDQASSGGPPARLSGSPAITLSKETEDPQDSPGYSMKAVVVLIGVFLFVFLLLGGGLGFTIYEFKRLSAEAERRKMAASNVRILSFPARQRGLRPAVASPGKLPVRGVAR